MRVNVSLPQGSRGEQAFFHAPEPVGTVAFGGGPEGPAFHAAWNEPRKPLLGWPPVARRNIP